MKRCRSCLTVNDNRKRKCEACGKTLAAKRKPAHLKALDVPYETFVERYGERCGVCGVGPSERRRLDRDHDHKTGAPRGLLCHRHNRLLSPRMNWSPATLRAAADYLERSAA